MATQHDSRNLKAHRLKVVSVENEDGEILDDIADLLLRQSAERQNAFDEWLASNDTTRKPTTSDSE